MYWVLKIKFGLGVGSGPLPGSGTTSNFLPKRTSDLIPLCHPLLVGSVYINFTIGDDHVEIESQVETVDRTGVEMEALTACSVAALTIYDMCKSADRTMVIGELALWEKVGGRSGTWKRPGSDAQTEFNL